MEKRRAESNHLETSRPLGREDPDWDMLRMQAQAFGKEAYAVQEPQRRSQEESTFLDQIYDLLQHSPEEIERILGVGDWDQQSPRPECLTSFQHEAPFSQAASSRVEPVDEARCHQIVECLMNPQEMKRLPSLTQDEHQKIEEILDKKCSEGAINLQSYESFRGKLYDAWYYEKNKVAILAKQAKHHVKYYEKNKAAIRAKQVKYYEKNKAAIRAKYVKYYEKNKAAILAKQVKYYEKNKAAILAKQAENYEKNKVAILAKRAENYKKNKNDIIVQRAEYKKRQQDPKKHVEFLERTLQNAQDKYNKENVALHQDIQFLHQQEATSSSEVLSLRQAQDQPELPRLSAVTHEPCFEEISNERRSLLQAPYRAEQLQTVEDRQREYNQLDEDLEALLASFHDQETFEPGSLF